MEMEIMIVFYSGILFQKGYLSATLSQGHKKSCWITDRFHLKIFDKKKFVCVPLYPERGICGRFTQTKFKVNLHLINSIQNAGQHMQSNSKSFQAKAIIKFTSLQQDKTDLSIT